MECLFIDSSSNTPQVDMNPITGEMIISGRSVPENAVDTYDPVFKWVEEYRKKPRPVSNLRLNLEYFNTSSSLWISKIIRSLSKINQPDYVLFVHLYFGIEEFDDMESEDLRDALSPIIDIISLSSISIGIKIYGIDNEGVVIKENIVLI